MEPVTPEIQTNDIEILKKMEDEHLRLQRQVRLIQADRQNRTLGVHPQLRRQDQLLHTLKKEYLNLYTDIKIARSGAHKKNDKKMKADLTRAVMLRTKTGEECDERLTLMGQLEELLYRKYKQMLHLKKIVIAKSGQLEVRRSVSENRLTSTENKLEVAMWRFNEVQCENKKIREEIEHLLNDRAVFNQSWNKMLVALNKGKKFLTDLFESSTLAYDQRDEWCTKLKSAQEKGKMDQMVQVQEMRDLQKAFDHEMKLYNFLAKKGVMRVNKKEDEREEYHKIKKAKDIQQNIEAHTKILDDINEYTNEYDIDKIIDQFEQTEQENFSMYKLLNESCAENEVLKRSLDKIKLEIADRKDWNEMMDDKRQIKLEELRHKLEIQKTTTEEKRKQFTEKNYLLNETMEKVKEMFKLLDCSEEPYQHFLGDKRPSLNHVNLTFTLITEKIKEMVCIEARWLSRISETLEIPFDKAMTLKAIQEIANEPAFERSDRMHPLTDCRAPRSRLILARRYMQN